MLLASERSRLPVLMPARDVKHLASNFPDALAEMLDRLGISEAAVEREVDAAREVLIATTNNRSVLGTLNDYTNMLQWTMPNRPNADLMDTAVWLAHTPVRPIDGFPDDATRGLFGEGKPHLRLIRGVGIPTPNPAEPTV